MLSPLCRDVSISASRPVFSPLREGPEDILGLAECFVADDACRVPQERRVLTA
ncbi:hypothetical protein [Thiocapsa sp.]|uniref:hypothetical protein n=1 Tax=Thiocapsa sp. TaxID=2024551 RepID=UPI002D7F5560|nr:hypothetical protein [Thiocapsa sp.]